MIYVSFKTSEEEAINEIVDRRMKQLRKSLIKSGGKFVKKDDKYPDRLVFEQVIF